MIVRILVVTKISKSILVLCCTGGNYEINIWLIYSELSKVFKNVHILCYTVVQSFDGFVIFKFCESFSLIVHRKSVDFIYNTDV